MATEMWIIVGSLIGFTGTTSLIIWKIARDGSIERGKIYNRIRDVETTYVSHKFCDERSNNIFQRLNDIKEDTEKLRTDLEKLLRKNGL